MCPACYSLHMKRLPATLLSAFCLCSLPAAAARAPFSLSDAQQERLNRALASLHEKYNPATKMVSAPFSSPGYHTTLKGGTVHSTRAAFNYAVALLDTGDDALLRRACDILDTVIALQDTDPQSKTYGIWSWFLEEPLAQMAPPDWNWADFCGTQLLQVALDHRDRLPPDLAQRVDDAIRHAARSIERRNVGPGYTNIALMGTYVTYVTAELYGIADLKDYAAKRLRRFYDYTKEQGAFSEYNSPTYSVVALEELGRMRLHIQDTSARALIDELYRAVWQDIAMHFHAPSRQWAGPHSRCYGTLVSPATLNVIQNAAAGALDWRIDKPSISEHRLPLDLPPEFIPFFQKLDTPREVINTYLKADPPIIGTTWMEPTFTLGSASRGEFWNQRRGILAYWGTPAAPAYLQVRFLRDDYDFSAAQLFTAQKRGDLLAAVNFATDGGNTHIGLDRLKNGLFTAKDLRLRFEFGGSAAAAAAALAPPASTSDTAAFRFGDLRCLISLTANLFDGSSPAWVVGRDRDGKKAWLDLVLYVGEERAFDLTQFTSAALGFALRLSAREDAAPPNATTDVADGRLALTWDSLRVAIPVKPATVQALQRAVTF